MTTLPGVPPITYLDDAQYRPGACNIGPEEIAMRRRAGITGLAVAAALAVGLIAVGAPPVARLLVALPLAAGTVGLLQARLRFCAAYGMRGIRNFGSLGKASRVADAAAAATDRRRAAQILGASALVGLLGGVALAALPI